MFHNVLRERNREFLKFDEGFPFVESSISDFAKANLYEATFWPKSMTALQ